MHVSGHKENPERVRCNKNYILFYKSLILFCCENNTTMR